MLETMHILKSMPKLREASYRLRCLADDGKYYEDKLPRTMSARLALHTVEKVFGNVCRPEGYWEFGDYIMRR